MTPHLSRKGAAPVRYICPECNLRFTSKYAAKQHKQVKAHNPQPIQQEAKS